MDKLFLAICPQCDSTQEVWSETGPSIRALGIECENCLHGPMGWLPMIGSADAREVKDKTMLPKKYGNYRAMEKDLKTRGLAALTPSEYNNLHTKDPYEAKPNPVLDECVRKSYYRVRHGYRDYPDLPKE